MCKRIPNPPPQTSLLLEQFLEVLWKMFNIPRSNPIFIFDVGRNKTSGVASAAKCIRLAWTKPNLLDMDCKEQNPQH